MRLDIRNNTVNLKIVYWGPGLSGKTTNLEALHRVYGSAGAGPLMKLDTQTERTLFFDYFPANIGSLNGYEIHLHLFTVPGQSFYEQTRRAVLDGADGIVFVADSSARREEANVVSKQQLERLLNERDRPLESVPHVYQWNKRDASDALPVETLDRILNPEGAPSIDAVASEGIGVWDAQTEVVRAILQSAHIADFTVAHAS